MKRIIFMSLVFSIIAAPAFSQGKSKKDKKETDQKIEFKSKLDTVSYILGADVSRNIRQNGIEFNPDFFFAGLKDAMTGLDSLNFPKAEVEKIMRNFQEELASKQDEKQAMKAKENKAMAKAYLEANKKNAGVVELPSGLQYKILTPGEGSFPLPSDTVTVHYTGTLIDGNKFDSSRESGQPVSFPLSGVIPGWTEGLQFIKPGGRIMLYIPSNLAYGDREVGPIPSGSLLIFDVELLSISKK
jgi:FKBP-type peptidyl-prolyl cis-trans isomerase